jgi:hypothetical protein
VSINAGVQAEITHKSIQNENDPVMIIVIANLTLRDRPRSAYLVIFRTSQYGLIYTYCIVEIVGVNHPTWFPILQELVKWFVEGIARLDEHIKSEIHQAYIVHAIWLPLTNGRSYVEKNCP